jgi:hypothetical protein
MKIRRSIPLSCLTFTAMVLCGCPSNQPTPQPTPQPATPGIGISLSQIIPQVWEVTVTNTVDVNITGFSAPTITDAGEIQEETPRSTCTDSTTLTPGASCVYTFVGAPNTAVGNATPGTITLHANLPSAGTLTATLPTTVTSVLYAGNHDGSVSMWNGSVWSQVGTSGFSNLNVLSTDVDAAELLFAGTGTNDNEDVSSWNGAIWTTPQSNSLNNVNAYTWGGGSLYAGTSASTGSVQKCSMASFTSGCTWSPVGSGDIGNVVALISDHGNLFAATTNNNIQELEGTTGSWRRVGPINLPLVSASIAIDNSRTLYAALPNGYIYYIQSPTYADADTGAFFSYGARALTYDAIKDCIYGVEGADSLVFESGGTGPARNFSDIQGSPTGVNALIADPVNGDLYAGYGAGVAKYNGTDWTSNIDSTNTPTSVNTLAIGGVLSIQAPQTLLEKNQPNLTQASTKP